MGDSPATRIYAENYDDWVQLANHKCFSDKQLGAIKVVNGIVLPSRQFDFNDGGRYEGGVCDENLNFIAGNIRINEQDPGYLSVCRSYNVPKEEITFCDEEVIFGGVIIKWFGHVLGEGFGRCWYPMQYDRDKPIVFILLHDTVDIPGYVWEFFSLLGIKERARFIHKPTKFLSVVVPDESIRFWGGFFTKEYLVPYEYINQRIPHGNHKKIYLTRRKWGGGVQKIIYIV